MKKAAVIHDLSGFGKCSLTAAIPVLSALGVQCCPVATAVLTGQTGYPCYHCTDLTAMLPDYIDAWGKNNAHFDAIYSGFLTGAEQISQVLDFIRQFREEHTLLLVDPVMGDDGNAYPFFTPGLLNGMKELTLKDDAQPDGSLSAGRHPGKCLTSLPDEHGSAEAGRRCGTAAAKKNLTPTGCRDHRCQMP